MAILIIIGILMLGALIFGPQFWVRHVIKKYSEERPDLPGTGGELAQHLSEKYELAGLKVESTQEGDHFDPDEFKVRLTDENLRGKSIAAVAIAAHEVGHAIQHHHGENLLKWRQILVKFAMKMDIVASIFFFAAPVLAAIARTPAAFFGLVAFGIALLAVRIIVHLVTLPVEWDASFKKALPILEAGGYLSEEDMPAARKVLKAAALTYVSAALMSLVDLARWIRILR